MWVKFTQAFLWTPKNDRRWSIQYADGQTYNVTRACGETAIAAGAAVRTKSPRAASNGDTDAGARAPGPPHGAPSSDG